MSILKAANVVADMMRYSVELRQSRDRRSLKAIRMKSRLMKKYKKWLRKEKITPDDYGELISNLNAIDGDHV